MKHIYLNRKIPLLLGMMLLALSSCKTVRLISDYDVVTDNVINALQEKVSRFFIQVYGDLETGDAKYDHYKEFYQEAKVDLVSLKIRADAFDKNTIVQQQIAELYNMIDKLEQLHKLGFSVPEQIKPLELPFNAAFTAMIRLQLALKRGAN